MHISDVTALEGPDPGFWVPNGYVVLAANARGYYDSEGQAGIYSEKDAEDLCRSDRLGRHSDLELRLVGLNGVS